MQKQDDKAWIAISAMAIILVAVLVPAASGGVCETGEEPVKCLREWMQASGAILAVMAGGVGAYYLDRQLRLSDNQERNRRTLRFHSIRATLPIYLSMITAYAEGTMATLKQLQHYTGHAISLQHPPEVPEIPFEAVKALQEFIEFSDGERPRIMIALLAEIQVHNARMVRVTERSKGGQLKVNLDTLTEYVIDAAKIYALTSSMYDFSRFRRPYLPSYILWDDVHRAIKIANIDPGIFPDLAQRIERRAAASSGIVDYKGLMPEA